MWARKLLDVTLGKLKLHNFTKQISFYPMGSDLTAIQPTVSLISIKVFITSDGS